MASNVMILRVGHERSRWRIVYLQRRPIEWKNSVTPVSQDRVGRHVLLDEVALLPSSRIGGDCGQQTGVHALVRRKPQIGDMANTDFGGNSPERIRQVLLIVAEY